MNISEIHTFIGIVKNQEQGGYHTPAEIDAALSRASLWAFNDWRSVYPDNVEAFEALAPFKTKLDFTTDSGGAFTVSGGQNYMQVTSMEVSVVDNGSPRRFPVKLLREDEIASRLNSQRRTPTAKRPCAEEVAPGSFLLYPAQVHGGTIRFFRKPVAPVFGYTQVGRAITYNSGTSTQLEWTEPYLNKVIFKALAFLGVNLSDDKIAQYSLQLQTSV